ncbi:hypothetical protein [Chamaesiphon minutus]|uniref:Uncharacterized protein n=1 Tax=Chamaesiphon minutus (strain ATCC 27169 / PCC 6605) TaxID=1173020 RepID=K9UCY6_CHAP6|nr:hypothetical protein [Chamaesiphon minutus]AFY92972.1 hypothetical protein Cha6605_1858 [Chamaesiphon minutus PCC 6605]
MKRYLSIGLAVVAISLAANTSVQARGKTEMLTKPEVITKPEVRTKPIVLPSDRSITPCELVSGAYQGQYRAYSIPGFGAFSDGVRRGKITAKDLVKAAIDSKRLPPQAIEDRSYLGYVDLQLKPIRF